MSEETSAAPSQQSIDNVDGDIADDELGKRIVLECKRNSPVEAISRLLDVAKERSPELNKAIVNHRHQKKCALDWAAYHGSIPVLQTLLDAGAWVHSTGMGLDTPMHEAASNGKAGAILLLARRGMPTSDIDQHGRVPLHSAAFRPRNPQAMESLYPNLVAMGLRITPYCGSVEAVNALLELGADINARSIVRAGALNWSLLWRFLCYENCFAVCSAFVKDSLSSFSGCFCLAHVSQGRRVGFGNFTIFRIAVSLFKHGQTALHYAVREGDFEMVELLVKRKARLNLRDRDGCTPFCAAHHREEHRIMRLLLDAGAAVNCSCIHRASLLRSDPSLKAYARWIKLYPFFSINRRLALAGGQGTRETPPSLPSLLENVVQKILEKDLFKPVT